MLRNIVKSLSVALLFSSGLLWATAQWNRGGGIQGTLSAADWNEQKGQLLSCNVDRAPYHLAKRTRRYDHEVHILTPFARTSRFVRENKNRLDAMTFDEASKVFNPPALVLVLRTKCVDQSKAAAMLMTLRTESGTIQPLEDKFIRSSFDKVGYYGQWYHFVEREFTFDLAQVSKAKTLTVCITEAGGQVQELEVDLADLR